MWRGVFSIVFGFFWVGILLVEMYDLSVWERGVRYKLFVFCLRFLVLIVLVLCMLFAIGWYLVRCLVVCL